MLISYNIISGNAITNILTGSGGVINDDKTKIAKINLDQLQDFVDKKRIDVASVINLESLKKNNIINKSYLKFKLLGNGNLNSKIDIEVDYSSISAKEKIENLGGILKIKNPK